MPVAIIGGLVVWAFLRHQPDPKTKARIDAIGLGLLIIWVGALEIMLEEGRDKDWFSSPEICIMAAIAVIGFLSFLIWELTDENPIVDLRIFRHRGFTAASVTFAGGFAAFFASVVILPLWLQQNMGYTATWAGYATGIMGILAMISAPIVGKVVEVVDARIILSTGPSGAWGDDDLAHDLQWRCDLHADGLANAVHRSIHGDVLRTRHRAGSGHCRAP